jgi:lon-related putative ATP-dependent protease
MTVSELPPAKLRLECPPESVGCESSADFGPEEVIIGQERALKAIRFGIDMKAKGFNIYAAGVPLSGKRPATRNLLVELARKMPTPSDWAYVNNFEDPFSPTALQFPAGRAQVFKKDLKNLIDQLKRSIPATLQSEEFVSRTTSVTDRAVKDRNRIMNSLAEEAQKYGYLARGTQLGITIVPMQKGKPLSQEEFDALPPSVKSEYEKNREKIRTALDSAGKQVNELDAKAMDDLRKLRDESVHYAIGGVIDSLVQRYQDVPDAVQYLQALKDDIMENTDLFIPTEPSQKPDSSDQPPDLAVGKDSSDVRPRRYEVNIVVDNKDLKGAPVISEDNPTVTNLLGRIEKESRFGALTTDFTLIKSGSLHRANGGYLILGARELLTTPLSYEGLKRMLLNGSLAIEETSERMGVGSTKSLTPQSIPLNVKVVLAGDHDTYQTLYTLDPDFRILFKVKADFDDSIERNDRNLKTYGSFVHSLCEREQLNHLDGSGLGKVVEYGSRLAEDQAKLSTKFPAIADLVREANFYSLQEGSKIINGSHVMKALQEKVYRSNLLDEKVKEMIQRGIILIDTSGAKVGQVNGLSVISLGDFDFGQPSRITASVGLGRSGVIDIERESRLGGQIHTKGVLIISGYLEGKYAHDKLLALSCRLVFEQSYGGVEGDSASSTELYAILSALSELPIKQNLAVTGSVNQKGEVQAIGGINEKIEGFYKICKARGLKGDEGVMLPKSNVQHLMLDEEVVQAVKDGRFHVYPISTIDEGIELLTGVMAGELKNDGSYEAGTVHYKVNKRLAEMAEAITKYSESSWSPRPIVRP